MSERAQLPLVANVSLLFGEVPYLDRFARAAAAGFTAVETWWPWPQAVPADGEVTAFLDALDASGMRLAGLNLFAGDMPGGERGILSWPDREADFAANLDLVAAITDRTGCPAFNALYGQRRPEWTPQEQDATARERLATAVDRLGALGGTVLVEPLGRGQNGAYPLATAAEAVAVVERARADTGRTAIGLLYDTFHLATSGDDLLADVDAYAALVAHVQVADAPGRGQPGTGAVDVAAVIDRLWEAGYRGAVACEYRPTVVTEESLDWVAGVPRLAGLR